MPEPTRRRSPRAAPIPDAVLDYVLSSPWAITEAGLQRVLAIASRLHISPEALSQVQGEPLDNTRTVSVREGVATIPVHGVLMQRGGFFSAISGATSYTQLAFDVRAAIDDPNVKALLLDIDSPGGDVAGCHELWQQLMAVRGVKPIEAYIGGDGCSAGYWLASAADRIHASDTSIVGCLGVRMSAMDDSRRLKREGYTRIEIVSSQTPAKAIDPTAPEGLARVQRMIDDLAAVFLDSVATARGVAMDTVLEQYGGGDVRVGKAALAAGLVDALSSYEAVHAALAARAAAPVVAAGFAPLSPAAPPAQSSRSTHSGDGPMALRKNSRAAAASRRGRVRAAFAAGDEVTIGVTRDVGVTEGDIGVIDEVVEGRFYAVSVGDGDDMYAWLAESELALVSGESADEGTDGADASDTNDDEEKPDASDDEEKDDAEASDDEEDEDKPGARRSSTRARAARQVVAKLRTKAANAERARILGILAYEGKASAATIRACIEDATCTPAKAAQRILEAGSGGGTNRLRALRTDEQRLADSGLTQGAPTAGATKQAKLSAAISAGYNRKRHGGRAS